MLSSLPCTWSSIPTCTSCYTSIPTSCYTCIPTSCYTSQYHFCTKQYWVVHQPITFLQLCISQGGSNHLPWLCDTTFFTCTHMHGDRQRLCHPLLTQRLNRCLVSDPSANTAYIYSGSLWGQTCCSVIDGKLQLKHAQSHSDESCACNCSTSCMQPHCTMPCIRLVGVVDWYSG